MLTYQLCKRLKEAGMPQTYNKGNLFYVPFFIREKDELKEQGKPRIKVVDDFWINHSKDHPTWPKGEFLCECSWCLEVIGEGNEKYIVKIPTLSELIEVCGDRFFSLETDDRTESNKWIAMRGGDWETKEKIGIGKTPEEAVAKLYLKLKEK